MLPIVWVILGVAAAAVAWAVQRASTRPVQPSRLHTLFTRGILRLKTDDLESGAFGQRSIAGRPSAAERFTQQLTIDAANQYKPRAPIDRTEAMRLAVIVRDHVNVTLGMYSPSLIMLFKQAAGLRRPDGTVDGRYDGAVVGALVAFIPGETFDDPTLQLPFHEPLGIIEYPPQYTQFDVN